MFLYLYKQDIENVNFNKLCNYEIIEKILDKSGFIKIDKDNIDTELNKSKKDYEKNRVSIKYLSDRINGAYEYMKNIKEVHGEDIYLKEFKDNKIKTNLPPNSSDKEIIKHYSNLKENEKLEYKEKAIIQNITCETFFFMNKLINKKYDNTIHTEFSMFKYLIEKYYNKEIAEKAEYYFEILKKERYDLFENLEFKTYRYNIANEYINFILNNLTIEDLIEIYNREIIIYNNPKEKEIFDYNLNLIIKNVQKNNNIKITDEDIIPNIGREYDDNIYNIINPKPEIDDIDYKFIYNNNQNNNNEDEDEEMENDNSNTNTPNYILYK